MFSTMSNAIAGINKRKADAAQMKPLLVRRDQNKVPAEKINPAQEIKTASIACEKGELLQENI
jgi:hypothetical protein